jgi:hypothetical protein
MNDDEAVFMGSEIVAERTRIARRVRQHLIGGTDNGPHWTPSDVRAYIRKLADEIESGIPDHEMVKVES